MHICAADYPSLRVGGRVRDEEELMRVAIRLLELPGSA
jgi:hypothetical protein